MNIPQKLVVEGKHYELNIEEGQSGITTCIYECVPKNDEHFFIGSYGDTMQNALENMRELLIKEKII